MVIILVLFSAGYAQQDEMRTEAELDSLISDIRTQLNSPINDSIQFYNALHKHIVLADQADLKLLLAKAYTNLAVWHNGKVKVDSTEYYFKKSASIYKSAQNSSLEAETHLQLEDAFKKRGDYANAMTSAYKALGLYEESNNQRGIASVYTRLCDLLYYQQKYAEGAEYCQKAIDIQVGLNVPQDLSVSYRYKADNLLILEKYNPALLNINKAIDVLKKAGIEEKDIAPNYNTRGNIYKYLKRYDDAITEYQKCYNIAKVTNNQRGLIPSLGNIGHVYRIQGNYEKALPYTLEAIDLMEQSGNTQNLSENYMHASDSYKSIGEFEKALEYNTLYANEEFNNLETIIEQLETELQIKYETAKKDETIEAQDAKISSQKRMQLLYIGITVLLAVILFGMYYTIKNNAKKRKALLVLNNKLHKNQRALEDSNIKLKNSISELKSTQAQLVQSEKMASLGELTAGIAHEIQNPLNFVNNFSEVSNELIDEMKEELEKGDIEEAKAISDDVKQNLEKINHHGKRADSIVKGMLQHSRNTAGEKEAVDLNKLADEYLRLAYHGLRAKEKSFNANLETDFDSTIGKLNLVPQDIGRVILNLVTNAFYAVDEKRKLLKDKQDDSYTPTVSVATKKDKDQVLITVKDNGNGIPESVKNKIFEPFFTTKPTGQGTGLGLSMSYDIIKAHGGQIKLTTSEGKFTIFEISLPIKTLTT